MITASEARKIVEEREDEIISSPKYQAAIEYIGNLVVKASERGNRNVSFYCSDISDGSGSSLYIGSFYDGGEGALRRYIESLGYRVGASDHGRVELYW